MGWQHHFEDAVDHVRNSGLPKRLLRRLLFDTGLRIGSRVLVTGCTDTRLQRMLDGLGIDSVGIDDCADAITSAERSDPHLEFAGFPDTGPLPFASFSFDAVLVQDGGAHVAVDNLSTAVTRTGELASILRPAGELTILRPTNRPSRSTRMEDVLGLFPGEISSGVESNVEFTTLGIPPEPIERRQWSTLANVAIERLGCARSHDVERSAA